MSPYPPQYPYIPPTKEIGGKSGKFDPLGIQKTSSFPVHFNPLFQQPVLNNQNKSFVERRMSNRLIDFSEEENEANDAA